MSDAYIERTESLAYRICPEPEELAEVLWAMGEQEQARFFNHLGAIADNLPMQLEAVINTNGLQPSGISAMSMIGDYAEARKMRSADESEEPE